jgi:hypothetical protein
MNPNLPGFYTKEGTIKKNLINNKNKSWTNDPVTLNKANDPVVIQGDTTATVFSRSTINRMTNRAGKIRHPITRKIYNKSDVMRLPKDLAKLGNLKLPERKHKSKIHWLTSYRDYGWNAGIYDRILAAFISRAKSNDAPVSLKRAYNSAMNNYGGVNSEILFDMINDKVISGKNANELYDLAVQSYVMKKAKPGDIISTEPNFGVLTYADIDVMTNPNRFLTPGLRVVNDNYKLIKPKNIPNSLRAKTNFSDSVEELSFTFGKQYDRVFSA